MKPKARTNSTSCGSVKTKTRTACTRTSTPTVAKTAAGILNIGSEGLDLDWSLKITPDREADRLRERPEQGTDRAAFHCPRRQAKNKREDQCPPFCLTVYPPIRRAYFLSLQHSARSRPSASHRRREFGAPTAANLNLSLSLIAAKDCGRRAISVEQECALIEFCASIQNCSSFI